MTLPQKRHRPSSLKQQNKKHHTLGHKSKRQIVVLKKGKVSDDLSLKRRFKVQLSKEGKKNQHIQKRKYKKEETVKSKRSLGTDDTAPFLVLIVPMSENIKSHYVIDSLCTGDPDAVVDVNLEGVSHIGCRRFKKRLSFIAPSVFDLTSVLDAAKVSDGVLFIWDADEEDIMEEGRRLLTIMKSLGLPTVVHAISGLENLSQKKRVRSLKELKKEISLLFPEQSKIFSLDNCQDTLLLLRQLAEQKKHNIFYRDKRSHLLAEEVEFVGQTNTTGILKVSGYIRGQCLSVNSFIHIPGWEDYQIECIDGLEDPHPLGKSFAVRGRYTAGETIFPDEQIHKCLPTTNQIPTEELIDEGLINVDEEVLSVSLNSEDEFSQSDEYESDFSDIEEENCESLMDYESAVESFGEVEQSDTDEWSDVDEDNYDSQVDYEAEMKSLRETQAKEIEDNKNFPDEIDTPFDQQALNRFKKYRGLESFRTSPWEHRENLPLDYKRIFTTRNYNYLRKTILKAEQTGLETGSYVRIHLKNVSKRVYDEYIDTKVPLVLFSLLENEHKMYMLHVVMKSHNSGHFDAIKSKDRLIFHVGFRRFANRPIFSEHTSGNKFLFMRYFHPTTTAVASMFAPVIFSPCPVAVFKERLDGTMDLVATGSVYSADEKRIICKRICLSGHPFKIKPHVTVVRYMFFNREDIEFFKKIALKSKWGARGKIVGPIGTHGHMKCGFKEKLNSQDVVFLSLYKRVFPKWKYETLVNRLRETHCNDNVYLEESYAEDNPKAKRHKKVHFSVEEN